ncbi:MAG: ABC transporter ATP-binding protein, partial [Phycisphaerae bacterium]
YKKMKVGDLLRFFAELKGRRDFGVLVDRWLDRLQLSDWKDKKVEALSKGMAQKVQFIAAVIAEPELVVLDEPFSGLDPVNLELLRSCVQDLRRQGTTVIFSTHDMAQAEKMCDFIFMIYKGNKVLDGTLASIQDNYGQDTIRVRLDRPDYALDQLPGVARVTDQGRYRELKIADDADSQQILQSLMAVGQVEQFEIAKPSLHDIFVRIAGPESMNPSHVEEPAHA